MVRDTALVGRGVVLLFVCAVLLAAVIVTRPWEAPEEPEARNDAQSSLTFMATSEPSSAPPAGDGRTVSLGGSNVLLRYPEGYGLAVDGQEVDEFAAAQACSDAFDYCVFPSELQVEGEMAAVSVSHREDLRSEAACVLDPTERFTDQLPTVGGGGDHATANFGWLESRSAGGVEATGLRRLYFGGDCFEFVTLLVGTSEEKAQGLRAQLVRIVEDVTLPDGRTGLWSPGR